MLMKYKLFKSVDGQLEHQGLAEKHILFTYSGYAFQESGSRNWVLLMRDQTYYIGVIWEKVLSGASNKCKFNTSGSLIQALRKDLAENVCDRDWLSFCREVILYLE